MKCSFSSRSWQTASLTHRFCKAEETLCFPSYHVWCAWKNKNKGIVERCGLRGRRDWTAISSHEVWRLRRNHWHLIKTRQKITSLITEMKSLIQHFSSSSDITSAIVTVVSTCFKLLRGKTIQMQPLQQTYSKYIRILCSAPLLVSADNAIKMLKTLYPENIWLNIKISTTTKK